MKILTNGQYYGQKKKELQLNGVILSEYSYDIQKTDWHYHENPYFMYLLQGQLYDVNKKEKSTCSSGDLLFLNWQEKHFNYKHSKFAKGFHVEFKQQAIQNIGIESLDAEGSLKIKTPNAHFLLAQVYHEFHRMDDFSPIGIESLLLELCQNIKTDADMHSHHPDWLKTLQEMIHENIEPTSLTDLANALQVHPVHISRTFSKKFGCTLSEYFRRIKVKKAIAHMMDRRISLTEIAYLCGFSDQSHFSRTFKKCIGISPRTYRSQFLA